MWKINEYEMGPYFDLLMKKRFEKQEHIRYFCVMCINKKFIYLSLGIREAKIMNIKLAFHFTINYFKTK